MYYQNNLRIVKACFPHLLPLLTETNHTVSLEIQPSKTGVPVAQVNLGGRKLWLNSVYNPEAEAERWADKLLERNLEAQTLILCGGGFLYHLKAIAKRRRFAKIVCYEPDPVILRTVLEEVDLEELREVDFLWIGGRDQQQNTRLTSEYLTALILEMTLEVVPPYAELYGTEISAFREKLAELVRFNRCNLATMNLFSEQWLENYIQNLRHLSSSPGFRHFFQQFKGIPGIIVSAGPSLEKNLHLLKDLRERAVIICAGTTLQAMAKQGIFPHFLALIDGGILNKTIFGQIAPDFMKQIHLIYNGRVNWEFLNNYPGAKIYAKLDAETFSDYVSLRMQNYDFGMIKSGFSVSHTALDLADKLGCDPIIFIGQDLAYTGDKRYANSDNQKVDRERLPRGFFITKDQYGQDIVTNREFDNFRMLFETQIAENFRNKNIINATEGGLNIQGMVNRKLQDVIAKYCQVERGISQKIESVYNLGEQAIQKHLPDRMLLTREINTFARLGDKKAAELWERVERLRRHKILDGYSSEELDAGLRQISAEYKSLLNMREYHLLTKDLYQAKLAANEIILQRLAGRKEIGIYREKLQYWLNIFAELRAYFKFISQLCETSLTLEDEANQAEDLKMLIPSGTQLAEIANGFRNGVSLEETGKRVEAVINRKLIEPGYHANYFYYYAVMLLKKKMWDKALVMLEQALALNKKLVEVPFLLSKAYYATDNWSKALENVDICLQAGYRTGYCRRMKIKIAYRSRSYPAVCNQVKEGKGYWKPVRFYEILRIEALANLGLKDEAKAELQSLLEKYRLSSKRILEINALKSNQKDSEFTINYRSNVNFFRKRGYEFNEFEQVSMKACRFLDEDLIYDGNRGSFLIAIRESGDDLLQINTKDSLLICDTDNVIIYQRMANLLRETNDSKKLHALKNIPVLVLEHQRENWELIMQLYDFNNLAEWIKLRFLIAPTQAELERIFLDEHTAIPNVIYGTGVEEIKKQLSEIKMLMEYQGNQSHYKM